MTERRTGMGIGGLRDLAPTMSGDELLQRLLATTDEALCDNAPAHGHIRGCAITLAARLATAEAVLDFAVGYADECAKSIERPTRTDLRALIAHIEERRIPTGVVGTDPSPNQEKDVSAR